MTLDNPVTWSEYGTPVEPHQPERVPIERAEALPPAGGASWAKLRDGRILRIIRERPELEQQNPWRPGRVALVRVERVTDDRLGMAGGGHRTFTREHVTEAALATADEYAEAQERDRLAAERKAAKLRPAPYDALARYGFLRGIRGAEALVAAFRGRGAELVTLAGEIVLVTAGRPITDALADAAAAAAPVLVPYLETGHPPPCAAPHKGKAPEASRVVGTGAPVCEGHASGELELGR